MFEREAITRIRRRTAPATESPAVDASVPDITTTPDDGTFRTPATSFDFGTIATYPHQLQPQVGPAGGELAPDLAGRIREQQGGGAALEPSVRTGMEAGFGHNFADVRVHADGEADTLNRGVGASAFTLGSDIFLSREATSAGAHGGDALLAHELTHVVQQRGAEQGGPLTVGAAADAREQEADSVAGAVTSRAGSAPDGMVGAAQDATIQRQPAATAPPTTEPSLLDSLSSALTAGSAILQDPVNAATGYHGPVTVEEWSVHHAAASATAPKTRDPDADVGYIGDWWVVQAKISGPAAEAIETLHTGAGVEALPGNPKSDIEIVPSVQGTDTLNWGITPTTPGRQNITFSVGDALGQNGDTYTTEIAAGADPTWFKGRCSTAESKLNTLFAKGQEWFHECYINYMDAYGAFNAALSKQSSADKLVGELLLGALFAVGGGAIGGAVGGMMQDAEKAGAEIFKGLSKAEFGALTDAAKDLTKYVARLPVGPLRDKVLGSHGGGAQGATPQASTDPSKAGVAQGMGKVAAIDPEHWYAEIERTINHERGEVGQMLTSLQEGMDTVVITDPGQVFDWDPEQVVIEAATLDGQPLDQLGPVPPALAYERSMWEVWLENYSWKAIQLSFTNIRAMNVVGGKLEDEIDRVAKKFGETSDDWIERYGAKAKQAAEAEATKMYKERFGAIDEALGEGATFLDKLLKGRH